MELSDTCMQKCLYFEILSSEHMYKESLDEFFMSL